MQRRSKRLNKIPIFRRKWELSLNLSPPSVPTITCEVVVLAVHSFGKQLAYFANKIYAYKVAQSSLQCFTTRTTCPLL